MIVDMTGKGELRREKKIWSASIKQITSFPQPLTSCLKGLKVDLENLFKLTVEDFDYLI